MSVKGDLARGAIALAIALGAARGAAAQAKQDSVPRSTSPAAPVPSRLVRCAPASDVPCLITRLDLGPLEARLTARADSMPSRSWTGRLAGTRLVGPAVRSTRETTTPMALMVLLDLSGSMRGEGVAFVRSALRSFLAELPPTGVMVAVAPFESRRVAERIAAARFGTPAEAIAVLDALPPPEAAGNTALYSAVRSGIAAVDGAVRAAGAGTRGGLLVLTDGRNDVAGRRDDPGLLAGATGRAAARDAVERSGHQLWIVGAGNVDAAELRGLAGRQGQPYIIALNPVLLTESLTSVAREIGTVRELSFGLSSGSRLRLARARTLGAVRYRGAAVNDGGREFTRLLAWRPPLIALPAFEGIADSTNLPVEVRAVVDVAGTDAGRRWMLVIFFALFGVLLGGALPRLAWSVPAAPVIAPPVGTGEAAAVPGAPAGGRGGAPPAATAPTVGSGLRSDVHEVAPRKPDEVTASSARRVGRSP